MAGCSQTETHTQSFHFYPVPGQYNHGKRIIIHSEEMNLFNNGTFFILLQIMILIYIPASTLLTPYYEQDIDGNMHQSSSLQDIQPLYGVDVLDTMNQQIDEELKKLHSIIDNYGHALFPTLRAGDH